MRPGWHTRQQQQSHFRSGFCEKHKMQTAAVRRIAPEPNWEGACDSSTSFRAALEFSMMNLGGNSAGTAPNVYTAVSAGGNGVLDGGNLDESNLKRITYKSNNVTECVQVPTSEHVAEIVGRQGCKIKALRAKTNTYIKTPSRGEEPVFVITGRPDDVASAKREILAAADHFTQIRASRRSSSSQSPVSANPLSSLTSLSNGDEPTVTIQVRVPYRVVGLVVGPKGATIKRIQQNTNTYIVTPSRDKDPCFEVTGTKENVERAKEEIEGYIAMRTGGSITDDDSQLHLQHSPDKEMPLGMFSSPIFSAAGKPFGSAGSPMSADPYCNKTFQMLYSNKGGGMPAFDNSWCGGENKLSLPLTTAVFSATNSCTTTDSTSPIPIARSMSLPSSSSGVGGNNSNSNNANGMIPGGIKKPPSPFEFGGLSAMLGDQYPPGGSPVSSYSSNGSDGVAMQSPKLDLKVPGCLRCKCSEVVAALVPCGHHIFCHPCAMEVVSQKGDCPICHIEAESMLRIY